MSVHKKSMYPNAQNTNRVQFGDFMGSMLRNEVKWQILYAYWQIYRISTQEVADKYGRCFG